MTARLFILICLTLLASACGARDDDRVAIAIIDSGSDPFAADAIGPAAMEWRAATREGLVAFDAYGRIVPALAERWIVTDDGASYIFRLRDGAWPDGSRIDAQGARRALSAAIRAQRGTALGADLGRISEVRAMAGRVLEIRLTHPTPDLLALLARPELGLVRKGEGAGPMRGTAEGKRAELSPLPPEARGLPTEEGWNKQARDLELQALPAKRAIEAFADGKVRIVLGGTIADILLTDRGLSRGALRIDDVEGLFGLAFTHRDGFMASAENRAALAMAVDRDALMEPFGIGNWQVRLGMLPGEGPSGRLLPVAEWRDLSLEQRRALAAQRVARWRASGERVAALRIALPRGEGGAALFAALSNDFSAIGLESERIAPGDDADLVLVDRVASADSAEWYLNRFRCGIARRLCIEEIDDLLAEARSADPRAVRSVLIDEAAALVEAQQIFISFGQPVRWSLVAAGLEGFQNNAFGVHPLMEIAMRAR
ncbi:ABC transporter substrate-binding protein [Pseudoblastomonas halimionae]|uniref:Peptide ABC transporter substrate-binding protein n=1 Tax=Alteriqipengyuania halimionae TaxID=1926630 RepID=A0A6I4U4Z6_9SPHN|nr:ABC transporter substrate-binding protein [Alteriqipengyuania halimionae]MXP11048.1 peptide ABC transporter substrate-binding protein [Alteriqipengyuania halimionae]